MIARAHHHKKSLMNCFRFVLNFVYLPNSVFGYIVIFGLFFILFKIFKTALKINTIMFQIHTRDALQDLLSFDECLYSYKIITIF